jgi:catechol 2,3-dioxygenase-like lactoylglutathione lyase family enzyme
MQIPTTGVHHITLIGSSRQDTLEFYQSVLGMPLIFEQPNLDVPEETHLYFDPGDGKLITFFVRDYRETDPEPVEEIPPRSFSQDPPTVSTEIDRVRYRTAPLNEDREFTGPAALTLHASIDATDTTWIVYLHALSPSGERDTPSRGYPRPSHREVDEERSTPAQPYHPHVDPEPVTPGEIYEYRIGLPPIAVLLEKGHQLELEVRSMEMPFSETSDLPPGSHHLPHAESITHTVYADGSRPSHLLLPEIPDTDEQQWIDPDDPAHPGPVLRSPSKRYIIQQSHSY